MSKIKHISKSTHAIHLDDGRVYIVSTNMPGSINETMGVPMNQSWELSPENFGDVQLVPYGPLDNLPTFIRDKVSENNLAPGILGRQTGLLWGQGPHLYKLGYKNGEIVKIWMEDKEIAAWLKSWGFEEYLRACIVDFNHLGGCFSAAYLNRGHRIGREPKIARLRHIPAKDARLEWVDSRNIEDVKNIYVGDFENRFRSISLRRFPVFDPKNPAKNRVSAYYSHLYSFSRNFYSVPQFWGAMNWILRGSEVPLIFKYVTDNSINLAYHVHSPMSYWDTKMDMLKEVHPDWGPEQLEQELKNMVESMLTTMTEVLSGKENAGKLFHTFDVRDPVDGDMLRWQIEPIDQKTKDFVESQLKIAEASTSAITSGMGLHPSLSNVMVNGKLASGSELLYAFKLYLSSDVEIPSSIVLSLLNQAIAFNFPEKDMRVGFYHQPVKSEESLTSSARLKNN